MSHALTDVVAALEKIAPLRFAEEWDNVGLLVEDPVGDRVENALLAIDLTERVLDQAIEAECELIVAYHPPIFAPLPRLTTADTKQRIVLRAIRAGISIYSPHTALDTADGGVNDWLCTAFEGAARQIPEPLEGERSIGRAVDFAKPLSLDDAVARIKRHLGLDRVRVAAAPRHASGDELGSVALCAGAGGSVVLGQEADLYWTGEMRHHDVLAALEAGTSVVLCDHTNTERGYLPTLRERLAAACPDTTFTIASEDEEPLQVV